MEIVEIRKYKDIEKGFEFTFPPIEDTVKIKKIPNDGFISKYLTIDRNPEPPTAWGDDNLVLVHFHRDFWVEKPDIVTKDDIRDWYQGERIPQEDDYFIFPVKSLIHGGVHLAIGSGGFAEDYGGWDTSHVGACLASRNEFKTEQKGKEACEALVGEWNKYLSGDVYCVVREKLNKNKEVIDYDVVCGFYGLEHAEKELEDFEGFL